MEPLDCSTCKMEERCERTKEACKYPEGRKYGVVHRRISELEHFRARVTELEAALERIRDHEHRVNGTACTNSEVNANKHMLSCATGARAGHDCCSAIAAEALRRK